MIIVIMFLHSDFRCFKNFYQMLLEIKVYRNSFPHLVSYNRFVETMPAIPAKNLKLMISIN